MYYIYIYISLSFSIILYISIKYTGFHLQFDFWNVYDTRFKARTYELSTMVKYLFSWTQSTNNLFFAYFLVKKKKVIALLFFIFNFISFGIDGMKTPFFISLITILCVYIYKNKYYMVYKSLIPWAFFGLSLVGILEYILFGSFSISGHFVHRLSFGAVLNNSYYVDFFTKNPPDYFKNSFLRHLGFDSDYENIAFRIGDIYYGEPNMRVNSGMISDAIMNLGALGMLVMPLLLSFVLKLLDVCTEELDEKIYLSLLLYFMILLMNVSLMTSLLTGGLLISFLLFILLKYNKKRVIY